MKSIVLVLVVIIVIMIMACPARADGEESAEESTSETIQESVQVSTSEDGINSQLLGQIQALTDQVGQLSDELALLRADRNQPEAIRVVGVMPVEGVEIPGVGKDVLYAMLVTALYNAGMDIVIAKSMEDRFLGNVQRQEDLIREGFIDPVAAPRMGHLRPVTHTFSATVTLYEASENDPQFGPITFEIQGVRMRHASIRIDFALEEIYSGDVEKAFYVEAAVQERTGPVLGDASYDIRSIWMIAFDDALSQMVEYLSTAAVPARE